jgi:hypothetical protein
VKKGTEKSREREKRKEKKEKKGTGTFASRFFSHLGSETEK